MPQPSPTGENPTEWARAYAAAGLRVVPIRPGRKAPSLRGWTEHATTDADLIAEWWGGLYRGAGVGICPGRHPEGGWWFVVDIDRDKGGADGEDTWRDLLDTYAADEPETVEQISGGGGRHLLFRSPVEVRNDQAAALGVGVDIRGNGGQILAEPTSHPNGSTYAWVDGASPFDRPIADAPGWLVALATKPTAGRKSEDIEYPSGRPASSTRPGDMFSAATTWAQILAGDGWTPMGVGSDGEHRWCRPGKDPRDGLSATTGYGPVGNLVVFTTSIPWLPPGNHSKLSYVAHRDHGGDMSAAAAALRAAGHGASLDLADIVTPHGEVAHATSPTSPAVATVPAEVGEEPGDPNLLGWELLDPDTIAAICSGDYRPPTPTIGLVGDSADAAGLFYTAAVNTVQGEPGTGKSWLALYVAAEQITRGNNVLIIDYEDSPATTVTRLVALGVGVDLIGAHLRYWTPGAAAKGGSVPEQVADMAHDCTFAVVDSIGEGMAAVGASQNADDEVAVWFRRVARRIADQGPAVLLLDHVTKDKENRGRWGIGSQRKLAAVSGAAYTLDMWRPFSKSEPGSGTITVAKDRHGTRSVGSTAALVMTDPTDAGGISIRLQEPEERPKDEQGRKLPTVLMEKVSRLLEDADEPMSGRAIEREVGGRAEFVRQAIQGLVAGGHAEKVPGERRSQLVRLLTPYRRVENPVDNSLSDLIEPSASQCVPVRPECVPDALPQTDPVRPAPEGGYVVPPSTGRTRSGGPGFINSQPSASRTHSADDPPDESRLL